MKRYRTQYKGVYYRIGERIGGAGEERIYYIVFKKNGKVHEEKVGRAYADKMTATKAHLKRAARIENREKSRKQIRQDEQAKKTAEADKMTFAKLWEQYKAQRTDGRGKQNDTYIFKNYLEDVIGKKEPHQLIKLDIDRLRINLQKKLKPQSVKHILALIKRLVNYGVNRNICQELKFKIDLPKVDNAKTEDLSAQQLKALLKAIDNSKDIQAANVMRMALFTGMRRGELFKLQWQDIDFQRGFIDIRNPKGGKSQKIPLNEQARAILENHPKTQINKDQNKPQYSPYVFVTGKGNPFIDIGRRVNAIKAAADLPADFRALHGLRHTYASILASSGKVDIYTLSKLLTHKSSVMTARYAHLRDEALKSASSLAGQIIQQATEKNVIPIAPAGKSNAKK